jgi:hypothetical protein
MKLSDIKGEKALDVLADLLEPAAEIMGDKEVEAAYNSGQVLKAVKVAIKNHKKAVLNVLAITEGEDPETYQPNVFSLPAKLLEILNDPEIMGLFSWQGQTEKTSSGSATENTEADEM